MRDVAIISFVQGKNERSIDDRNEVEMLMPITGGALAAVDMTIADIGFTCSGSTDYLAGAAFSFVTTLDGVGPWPPIQESHVEMDGAWAVYEAWVKLQLGEIDTALVYCYGKSSPGDLPLFAQPVPHRPEPGPRSEGQLAGALRLVLPLLLGRLGRVGRLGRRGHRGPRRGRLPSFERSGLCRRGLRGLWAAASPAEPAAQPGES
jgi:hypothetical protein